MDLIKSARFLKSQLLNFVVFGIAITSVVMSSAAMATAPTVTIGVTPNQTTIAAGPNGASVYVTGTFSSTSSVSYIRILNGTTELGIAFWGGGDSYGFAWNNVPTGTYSLTAEATDATGAIGTSSPITITVIPDVAPTATINTPVANASFSAGPDGALIYVFGTFSSSTSSVNLIRIYNGTTLLGNGFWGGGDSYGFEWRGVPAGTYNLIAQATDAAGLTGSSAPVPITVVANVPPTVSILSPPNNSTFSAGSNGASIQITGNVGSSNSTVSQVRLYSGATLLGTGYWTDVNAFGFNWTNVPAGSYTLTAQATDAAGMSATSGPVNLVVSAPSPPSIYEESPRDITTATQTPRIRALLSSSSSTINVASTRLFVDGVNVSAQAQISAAQVLWVPATPIAQGLHQVRVETADANGLTASKDWQFTIALPPPPPTQQDIPDGVRSPISISPSIQAAQ